MKSSPQKSARRPIFASAAFALLIAAAPARATEIRLPRETAALTPSPLPGYPLAQAMCATCHSADYVLYQPVSSRAYWQATVVKMQKVFAGPLPDTAIDPIVDYLTKTYGTERNGAAPAAPAAKKG